MFEQNCSVVEPQPVPERITSHSIFNAYGMGGGGGGDGGWLSCYGMTLTRGKDSSDNGLKSV